jgi:hypothetical protein
MLVTTAVLLESGTEELQVIVQAFTLTKGSGAVQQCGKYSLFVGRRAVRVGIKMQVNLGGLP